MREGDRKAVIAIGIVAVFVAGIAITSAVKPEKTDNSEGKAAPIQAADAAAVAAPVDAAPPVDVLLPQLLRDYRENEIAADAKYRDKVLRVTAVVGHVGKRGGDPIVVLQQGKSGFTATFSTDVGLAELKPYQEVTMLCVCKNYLGAPELSACSIERHGAGSAR